MVKKIYFFNHIRNIVFAINIQKNLSEHRATTSVNSPCHNLRELRAIITKANKF
jgi:hypothetical protein